MHVKFKEEELKLLKSIVDGSVDFKLVDNDVIESIVLNLNIMKINHMDLDDFLYNRLLEMTDPECFDIYDAVVHFVKYRHVDRLDINVYSDKIDIHILRSRFEKNKISMLNHSYMIGKTEEHRPFKTLIHYK